MDTMKDSKKITRRRHGAELKAQVLSESEKAPLARFLLIH